MARAARLAPPPPEPARPCDRLLDGFALLSTKGPVAQSLHACQSTETKEPVPDDRREREDLHERAIRSSRRPRGTGAEVSLHAEESDFDTSIMQKKSGERCRSLKRRFCDAMSGLAGADTTWVIPGIAGAVEAGGVPGPCGWD